MSVSKKLKLVKNLKDTNINLEKEQLKYKLKDFFGLRIDTP